MSPSAYSSSSGRWRPTPEQLMVLHQLYGIGLTNPNAAQIQRITAHLSLFGTIQGKNVFYWFQNHKARQRQKLRKKHQLAKQLHQLHLPQLYRNHDQLINSSSTSDFANQLFNSYSSPHQDLLPQQGTAEGMTYHQTLTVDDLPRDCLIRIDGRDLVSCKNRPLETLELFPLRSPNTA